MLVYFIVMFPLRGRLEARWEYGFVALVWLLFRPGLRWSIRVDRWAAADVGAMLACGYAVFRLAGRLALPDPFDLHSRVLACFLLLIGPLTEEFVFRGALWALLSGYFRTKPGPLSC